MKGDKCNFNIKGHCRVTDEFPELKEKPCAHNTLGLCYAKAEDLISICADCGLAHIRGECLPAEDVIMVPIKVKKVS